MTDRVLTVGGMPDGVDRGEMPAAAAPPGLLSALDLPLITGKGVLEPVPGPSPDSRVVGIR
jgi:hypothetical protein